VHPFVGGPVVLLGFREGHVVAVTLVHLAGLGRGTALLYEHPGKPLEVVPLLGLLTLALGLSALHLLPSQVALRVGLQLLVGPSVQFVQYLRPCDVP
jgi:hypothetical protein